MKITLTKYGGQAAGMRRPPHVVAAAKLPPAASKELTRLVAAAKAAPVAEEKRAGRIRDGMGYTITVDDGGHSTELSQSDGAMSPAFSALLHWIEQQPAEK